MTTLTINIPDKEKNLITQMIKKLGGEVIRVENRRATAKEKALFKLEDGFLDIKKIKEGKQKGLTLDNLFDE